MKIIAIEEHYFPADVLESAHLDLGPRAERRAAALADVGEDRLRMMDAAGIDVQVLSILGSIVEELEPPESSAVSRDLNDRLSKVVAESPDRFRAFATLPMSSPETAGDELRRGVEELGLVGAMIHGQTRGVFLDDPSVRPVLAAAEKLGVPIYLHPAPPPPAVRDAYFSGLEPQVAAALSTAAWGWHAECGMHVLRMVAGGVFEQLPDLQLIVGHMGEGLPFHLDRVEDMLSPLVPDHELTVAETLRRNLHITTAGYPTAAPLACAMATFGVDRIVFSVDHPFADSDRATTFLRDAALSPADRAQIAHVNAEKLLGI